MKKLVFLLAGTVAACTLSPTVKESKRGLFVEYDQSLHTASDATMASAQHCSKQGLAPVLTGERWGGGPVTQKLGFECRDPSDYGPMILTEAFTWQPEGAARGARIFCPNRLADCYRRADAICEGRYQVAREEARGAVTPLTGNLRLAAPVIVQNQTTVAAGSGTTAISGGAELSPFTDGMITGAAVASASAQRQAVSTQQEAIRQAALEHGKLWVTCGS